MMTKAKRAINIAVALLAVAILSGCGVKGDPIPPERPAELGRGRPTYRRATEKIRLKKLSPSEKDRSSDGSGERNGE